MQSWRAWLVSMAALSIAANTTLRFIGIDNAGNASSVATEI